MVNEEIKSMAVKVALEDGSFKQGITNLKQSMNVINSEFKASVSGVKDWGKSLDALKANATALGEKINVQKDIVKAYEQQLQKSKDTLSSNSEKMLKLKSTVEEAKTAWEQSKDAVGANDEATKKLKESYEELNNKYKKSESLVRNNNTSVKGYTMQLNNAKGALNGMESELKQTNDDVKNFDTNTKKATASTNKMAANINKKVNGALKAFAVGLAAAVAGMGALGKSSLEGASGLEGYRNTLNVVMKDVRLAGKTFKWAVDFANKTPFETDSVIQATVRLQSYGLKAKEVLPGIGDMAGVMNKDIMQAVEAVADAQTGELERMKEFGITKQMIIDKANQIMGDKEIVNKKGQITDQENFNKALFALMNDKFQGGMEIQANSFKGIWSTVKGVVKTSLAQMMGITDEGEIVIGGAFDTIKKKIKEVAETLKRWSKDGTLKEIGNKLQTAFVGIVNFITNKVLPAIGFLIDNFGTIKTVIIGVVGAMALWKTATTTALVLQAAHNVSSIASAAIHGGLAASTAVATKAQWGLNAAMVANPIGAIIAAVVALIAIIGGLIWWYNKSGDAAIKAADEAIDAARKQGEAERAEISKLAAAKKAEVDERITAETTAYNEKSVLLQKEYDEQMAIGEKELGVLKENLSKRQQALDTNHNNTIKAIRDEYGVFEEKQKSKTQLLQDEYAQKTSIIADILKSSENAATLEGEAFAKTSENILIKAKELHNKKITMYSEEYLLSVGVINDKLKAKIKGYQDDIAAIKKRTDDENALIEAQADAEKLIELQKKVDSAKTDEEKLAANEALQTEINRQNREKLLEQRNDKIDNLNQKIKDANEKATEEKDTLLQKLQDRIADEQVEIKKNTDYNISEIQREREAKEKAEDKKYEAAKKSMDKEAEYLKTWIDDVYKPTIDRQYQARIDAENEAHGLTMIHLQEEADAINNQEQKELDVVKQSEANVIIAQIKPLQDEIDELQEQVDNPSFWQKFLNIASQGSLPKNKKNKIEELQIKINDYNNQLHDMGIPGYATGVTNFHGGTARIHEKGGEIVNLLRGTNVIPHDVSMQIAKSVGQAVSSNVNNKGSTQLHFHVETLVGSDGMNEFANIMSRKMAGDYGLITGGEF